MTNLNEVIQSLCPNGVSKKSIGSLITRKRLKAKNYNGNTKVYAVTNSVGFVLSSDLHDFQIHSEDTSNYSVVEQNDFAYNPSRLNIGSIAFYPNEESGLISPMYVVFSINKKIITPQFLYLNICSNYVKGKIESLKEEGARFRFDFSRWDKIEIPLPPLPIQQRIVEILDKFTSLVSSLDSEIALRQKQYEFAGEKIFSLIDQQYPWYELGDVCEVYDGVHQTPNYVEKGIRFVSVENIDDIYSSNKYITEEAYNKYKNKPQIGDVFMTRITAGVIGQCSIVDRDEPLAYYVSLALLRPSKDISSRYLRAYLHSSTGKKELRKWIKVDATPTKINKGDINKVLILVPPFEKQREIVRTLDTFESLLTNLKKERALRQKQYEYYREKLLTFA